MRPFRIALIISFAAVIAIASGGMPCAADTDDGEIAAMKKEIAALRGALAALETRVRQAETRPVQAEVTKADEGIAAPFVTSFAKEIEVHGFADTAYIFNTNTPVDPNARTNNLRVFDTEANGFMLNMAEINFEKPISRESPLGFRIDLDFGKDAEVLGKATYGLGNDSPTSADEFDLKQAYAQFYLPFSAPGLYAVTFKVGKFATLHGAEVIESVNNWNYSRSFLFGYAIPFTHTGVRMYYKPFAGLPVESYFGIVNGWDNVTDNNRAKTVEVAIAATPRDNLSFSVGGMFGPERSNSNKDFRDLVDFVVTYAPCAKLTLKANYDYGWERNGATMIPYSGIGTPTGLVDKDASWDGIAAYAKYDIFDWWSVAGRGEFFRDRAGVRTGQLTNASVPMSNVELFEFTLTNEFKIYKNLITRFEYRYDKANGQVFTCDKVTANHQSTVSGEVIAKF